MTTLETARLMLKPLVQSDGDAIQAVFPSWEIVRWMSGTVPWPYPDDGAATFLSQIALPAMKAGKAWHWSIRRNIEPDRLIGVVSLMDQDEDNRGFWIDPTWQGLGFASEASLAVTDFWFDTLGRSVLRVPKAAGNPASRRISEKQGMKVVRRFQTSLVSGVQEVELWGIDRDAWRRCRAAADELAESDNHP